MWAFEWFDRKTRTAVSKNLNLSVWENSDNKGEKQIRRNVRRECRSCGHLGDDVGHILGRPRNSQDGGRCFSWTWNASGLFIWQNEWMSLFMRPHQYSGLWMLPSCSSSIGTHSSCTVCCPKPILYTSSLSYSWAEISSEWNVKAFVIDFELGENMHISPRRARPRFSSRRNNYA